jgi:beta-galactosidase/beta-glucuronidase
MKYMASISNSSFSEKAVPRSRIAIENDWSFATDEDDLGESQEWIETIPTKIGAKKCTISAPFQAQFPELRDYHGFVWYQNDVFIPEASKGSDVLLHFGAINYDPKIWVNKKPVTGDFSGGYFPVEAEIGDLIDFGETNKITVRVYFPHPRNLPYYPHGKQKWYGHVGGIWQNGYLEFCSKLYIENCFVRASVGKRSAAKFQITIEGRVPNDCSLSIKIQELAPVAEDSETHVLATKVRVPVPAGREQVSVFVPVSDPKLWSPDHPHCYVATVTLFVR